MAASSRVGLRDWTAVRKKWQDMASAAKKKRAEVRKEARTTGGGPEHQKDLTPEEERIIMILSKAAVEGVEGGIDVLGNEGLASDDQQPSGSGTQATTPSSPAAAQQSSPTPSRRRPLTAPAGAPTCRCSERLLKGEGKKLVLLQGIEAQLKITNSHLERSNAQMERSNALQEELLAIKRRKMEMEEKRLLLAEAQFIQGGGALPVPGPLPTVTPPDEG